MTASLPSGRHKGRLPTMGAGLIIKVAIRSSLRFLPALAPTPEKILFSRRYRTPLQSFGVTGCHAHWQLTVVYKTSGGRKMRLLDPRSSFRGRCAINAESENAQVLQRLLIRCLNPGFACSAVGFCLESSLQWQQLSPGTRQVSYVFGRRPVWHFTIMRSEKCQPYCRRSSLHATTS